MTWNERIIKRKIIFPFNIFHPTGSCKQAQKSVLIFPATVHGEGNGTPLQYSCLENPMDGGAWWTTVHGAAKSQTRLSDFTFTFHFHALEKEMATHPSVLAWRIPRTRETGGLPSMGSHRVGHDWSDLAVAVAVVLEVRFLIAVIYLCVLKQASWF